MHPGLADAAAGNPHADDELPEVRVLRAQPAQHPRDLRQPGRLRALGGRGPCGARRFPLACIVIAGWPIVEGVAEGELLVSREPLSFWGGYDFHTGEIIERRHPLAGVSAAGRVLAVPYSKGS